MSNDVWKMLRPRALKKEDCRKHAEHNGKKLRRQDRQRLASVRGAKSLIA
jgi:hypothetical protein